MNETKESYSCKALQSGRSRALFYSHDTLGLGHLRRTLLVCEGIRSRFPGLSTLIMTGSAMAHAMRIPDGVDHIKLPSVFKVGRQHYESRSLKVPFETIRRLREQIILQTTALYRPDFFFVDNVPAGMKGEILRTLRYVKTGLPDTRVFLILRDILDDKKKIVPFWRKSGDYEVLETLYDRIFVCGSPGLFDLVREYDFPRSLVQKTSFCGYLPRTSPNGSADELRRKYCPNGEKLILVTLGGGSDGGHVVENYLAALPRVLEEGPVVSVVLLGPDMDRAEASRLISLRPPDCDVTFLDFCREPTTFMKAADCVISMAGYNTISELLWLRKKSVVIPRTFPRSEQLIRSRLLHQRGMVEMIHPVELTPGVLAAKIVKSLTGSAPPKSFLSFTAIERLTAELGPYIRKVRNLNQGSVAL